VSPLIMFVVSLVLGLGAIAYMLRTYAKSSGRG
jgi:hypothetical protein